MNNQNDIGETSMQTAPLRTTTWAIAALAAALCSLIAFPASATEPGVFATGLAGPVKLQITDRGYLVVSERGTGANDGRLSIVNRSGAVTHLLSGLPSGIEVTGVPSGPSAALLSGSHLLHLLISEVDTLRFGPNGPPTQVPNPAGVSSPILSSVLRLILDQPIERSAGGFTLTPADHGTLADGHPLRLQNANGQSLWIQLVVDLKDFRPDPATNVRGSNPWGIAAGSHFGSLLLVDAGQNSVVELEPFGPPVTLLRFPRVPNAPGVIPPLSDPVPTTIRSWEKGKYLVTLFSGVPFAAGSSSVRIVDPKRRTEVPLISGLTSAIDVLPIGADLYVLEFSANNFAQLPGRLLKFRNASGTPVVVAGGLVTPSNLAYYAKERTLYFTEINTGRILRVAL